MNSATLRILDANFNRAREALRVLEDYARFVLNNEQICGGLKELRHDFQGVTASLASQAILHRDTPGDVGTTIKTTDELTRNDSDHVVIAAGKRLGEALRTIEEYVKTIDPSVGSAIEAIRYRFYDFEQEIARSIRSNGERMTQVRLYVLITENLCRGAWLEEAEQAILGGADCIQLREKELPTGELLARAKQLVRLCRAHNVICIINDRSDIAVLSDADGVHVGQEDLPAIEARKLLGLGKIVGVSTHNLAQARQAVHDGADYIGVGPVFPSKTKPRDFLPGLAFAEEVASAKLPIPAIAIAGITLENVDEVIASGVNGIAVAASVIGAADIRAAARKFKDRLKEKDVPTGVISPSPG